MADTTPEPTVVATFRPREKRFQLKTLPGGWIVVRRLSYGIKLERLQAASSLRTSIKASGRDEMEDIPAEITSALKELTMLAFKHSIVDHNLVDEGNRRLNFSSPWDVEALDPAVGDEISDLIESHNAELPEAEAGNS